MIAHLRILTQIALRNVFASAINVVIGLVLLLGTLLVVVGSSMVGSLDRSMSKSIIGSVAGHLQVYSAESKDELALYGSMGGDDPDLEPIEDFSRVQKALLEVDNVATVVPMGSSSALITSGNTVDVALAQLREAVKERDRAQSQAGDEGRMREVEQQIVDRREHVRQMVRVLRHDPARLKDLVDEQSMDRESAAALDRVAGEEFWADFEKDPYSALEFLENRIAPQLADGDLLYMRYVGTDLDAFQKSFDRMKIVDGQPVPSGRRGFLFSKFFYEEYMKLKTARRLDKIREGITEAGKTIAQDPELQRFVKENQSQTREILLHLDGSETRLATERLQKALGSREEDLGALLTELLATNDSNFTERYRIFYEQIAPLVELYRVRLGDPLTIKAYTRSGSVQSVNVTVYGTFQFDGIEKSPLAGGINLIDLMSFRDLYGHMTAEKAKEIAQLKAESGAKAVDRARAEEELFGSADTLVSDATAGQIDVQAQLGPSGRNARLEDLSARVYSQEEINQGVVLSAAVILEDPSRLDDTIPAIEAAAKKAGLSLKVATWQQAAGVIGQFVLMAKMVLFVAVLIVFVVAMLIINNAVMMATLQRTQMIGTMRAIGAQRSYILTMVLFETAVLGLVFGAIGAGLGAGFIGVLNEVGIPATTDVMYFFFSGPRLHPEVSPLTLVAAFAIILVVSGVSAFYPALLATRVQPVRAMQAEE